MVQRDPSPRGDKNGGDINLALDALELAFTHDHINAFAIVSGDSDFMALVNKLKQYDKTVFVVGGKAFTSHDSAEELSRIHQLRIRAGRQPPQRAAAGASRHAAARCNRTAAAAGAIAGPVAAAGNRASRASRASSRGQRRPPSLDLHQAMPLVERALQVLERREVRPQLGLLKSTMLQLDSSFSERAYGAGSFTDFIEKLRKADLIKVTGGEGRYMIQRKGGAGSEKTVAARRGAAGAARRAGKSSPGDGRRRGRRRSGSLGPGRSARLRLEAVRLPGVQRVPELRAG